LDAWLAEDPDWADGEQRGRRLVVPAVEQQALEPNAVHIRTTCMALTPLSGTRVG